MLSVAETAFLQQTRFARQWLSELQAGGVFDVHVRPGKTGVSVTSLLPEYALKGRGVAPSRWLAVLDHIRTHPLHLPADLSRVPPHKGERILQAYVIRHSYDHHRSLPFQDGRGVLKFVTDEPAEIGGERRSDILAIREVTGGASIPVVIELKSRRDLTRLLEQLEFADYVARRLEYFQELIGVLLGDRVVLSLPVEKWIVWPTGTSRAETNQLLDEHGVRVVEYSAQGSSFDFSVV